MSAPQGRQVRDRRVLLAMAVLVGLVLGANLVSALLPGLDALLAEVPVLVLLLVGGTVGVLAWSVGRRSRGPGGTRG